MEQITDSKKRVVLQWPSFGPYHSARLRACGEAAPDDVEVVGMAVAGQVEGRPWVADGQTGDLRIVTLFPNTLYHQLKKSEVASSVDQALDELQPRAVGISGYGMTDSRAALHWCRRHGAVKVLMSESKGDDAPRKWWKEWIKRLLVARFDSALCGGTPHRDYLRTLGMRPEKVFDKYDVVDNKRFATAAAKAKSEPEKARRLPGLESTEQPFFLVSSRFIGRKNLSRLLEAYRLYRLEAPAGWRLVILGTGPEEDRLKRQVKAASIPDVTFAGFRQFEELVYYYAMAGAFIHPALQEQWGLVVNEAMACGLPVLVSRTVGAAADLVREGHNGFCFDPENVGEMKTAMARLASDPDLRDRFSAHSREMIQEWSPRHFAHNFWAAVRAGGGL